MGFEGQNSPLSPAAIGKYADRVLTRFAAASDAGPVDLTAVLDGVNGTVEYVDSAEHAESSRVERDGTFRIFLPSFTSRRRDRFTVAHELGHFFLHFLYFEPDFGAEVRFNRGGRSQMETEANMFAASLLMPEESFKKVWGETGGDSRLVAEHFEVSILAAVTRAKVLGLEGQ